MIRFASILALAALVVSLLAAQWPARVSAQDGGRYTGPQSTVPLGFGPSQTAPASLLEESLTPPAQNQVRIRQRVVVRVSPAPPRARSQIMADLPRRPMRRSFEEVEHGNCVDVRAIVGVQPTSDNRLLFFTNEREVLAATLEQSCVARAFYAGFYVEDSDDGQLCVARDLLQSRAGASCEVAEFSRLVAVSQ
ncbi:hypothetical protein [Aurantiacibacter poecillastricola]|uniref:hypothetical protein n=1 Tax=Aurantiacibacter poecillastricola TaxID=3064385 RepID=UPI00273FEB3A|nr:hypothetical protein [Aurantiacibacter sp. 219JJ12-13]MDP5261725.1 hypothetical protein [Aurantiacibacter sp. 219JJ12-13]